MKTTLASLAFLGLASFQFIGAQDKAIFRTGQPSQITEVAYKIVNGEKVDTTPKKGFAGLKFPRKNRSNQEKTPKLPEFDVNPPAQTQKKQPSPFAGSPQVRDQPAASEPKERRRLSLPNFGNLPIIGGRRNSEAPVSTETEVMVNEGGTLVSNETSFDNKRNYQVTKSNTGSSKPPRKEGDSIIYNSWDDVESTKTSAADQIVYNLKKQEAAHKHQMAEAQRKYEAQVRQAQEARRKAEEEQKIRQLMGGSGGFGGGPSFGQ